MKIMGKVKYFPLASSYKEHAPKELITCIDAVQGNKTPVMFGSGKYKDIKNITKKSKLIVSCLSYHGKYKIKTNISKLQIYIFLN